MLATMHATAIKNCAAGILKAEEQEKKNRFIRDFANMHKNIRSDMFRFALENLTASYIDIHGVLDRHNAVYMIGQLMILAGVKCHFYDRSYLMHIRLNLEYKGSLEECDAPKVPSLEFACAKHVVVIHDSYIVEKLTTSHTNIDVSVRVSRNCDYCVMF